MEKLESLAQEGKINEEASVKDKQSITVNATIDQTWQKIVTIDQWSQWNSQIGETNITSVKEGATFTWTLNGEHFTSKISLLEKPDRFSFVSKSNMLKSGEYAG